MLGDERTTRKHFCGLIHIITKGEAGTVKHLGPPVIFADRSKVVHYTSFVDHFLLFLFHFYLSCAVVYVPFSLVVTCLLAPCVLCFPVFLSLSQSVYQVRKGA